MYICWPETGDIGLAGTCLICFCGGSPEAARPTTSPTTREEMIRICIESSFPRGKPGTAFEVQVRDLENVLLRYTHYPLVWSRGMFTLVAVQPRLRRFASDGQLSFAHRAM